MTTLKEEVKAVLGRTRAEELADIVKSFGDDTYENGTVVAWTKQYAEDGRSYSFAAIKADGIWYATTVRAKGVFEWEDLLIEIACTGVPTKTIHILEAVSTIGEAYREANAK